LFCFLRFFSHIFTLFLTFTFRSWIWMRTTIMYDFLTLFTCGEILNNGGVCAVRLLFICTARLEVTRAEEWVFLCFNRY
jgi:hypothetical protein